METPPHPHTHPNDLAYTIKTHYAGLILNRLRNLDNVRNTASSKYEPINVHISESYDDGEKDNTQPAYTLRYSTRKNTRVLELVITESSIHAYSDHIEKTIVINGGEKNYEHKFNICVLRGNDGNPIVLSTNNDSTSDKNLKSRIDDLNQKVLETLDLLV